MFKLVILIALVAAVGFFITNPDKTAQYVKGCVYVLSKTGADTPHAVNACIRDN